MVSACTGRPSLSLTKHLTPGASGPPGHYSTHEVLEVNLSPPGHSHTRAPAHMALTRRWSVGSTAALRSCLGHGPETLRPRSFAKALVQRLFLGLWTKEVSGARRGDPGPHVSQPCSLYRLQVPQDKGSRRFLQRPSAPVTASGSPAPVHEEAAALGAGPTASSLSPHPHTAPIVSGTRAH